jgi:hypothetical protein
MRTGLAAAVVLGACAGEATPNGGDRGPTLFGPDRVVAIELELDPAAWDVLRAQSRSWVELFTTCLAAPVSNPFTYFPASVTIDGVRIDRVGLRKKGFLGSRSVDKPSLRIALDKYVAGQAVAQTTDLVLNNSLQDPSYVRQCLAYQTFAAAGLPAPRCSFAHVIVNGHDLGLYVHVEDVGDGLLARHFDDPRGNLYEGTFSDFRDGWTETFELETNKAQGDRRDLARAAAALDRPDPDLVDAVSAVIDVDQFLTFWAIEAVVAHRDGYTGNANNFFAYHDPTTDRFVLIPWGADVTFRTPVDPVGAAPVSVMAASAAPWRLYRVAEGRDRYVARLRAVLDEIWDEDALVAEVDRMQALIAPIADPDGSQGVAASVDEVRTFIRGRREAITRELDAGPPPWDAPLPDPPCFDTVGEASGTLATRWGTAGGDAFTRGDGTLAATVAGVPLDVVDVGSTAGWDPADPARAQLVAVAALADATVAMVVLQLDPALVRTGARLPIDWVAAVGIAYRYDPSTATYTMLGLLAGGVVDLGDVATFDGAPVRAAFRGPLVRLPR